jgi:hypothetical protein
MHSCAAQGPRKEKMENVKEEEKKKKMKRKRGRRLEG